MAITQREYGLQADKVLTSLEVKLSRVNTQDKEKRAVILQAMRDMAVLRKVLKASPNDVCVRVLFTIHQEYVFSVNRKPLETKLPAFTSNWVNNAGISHLDARVRTRPDSLEYAFQQYMQYMWSL